MGLGVSFGDRGRGRPGEPGSMLSWQPAECVGRKECKGKRGGTGERGGKGRRADARHSGWKRRKLPRMSFSASLGRRSLQLLQPWNLLRWPVAAADSTACRL